MDLIFKLLVLNLVLSNLCLALNHDPKVLSAPFKITNTSWIRPIALLAHLLHNNFDYFFIV